MGVVILVHHLLVAEGAEAVVIAGVAVTVDQNLHKGESGVLKTREGPEALGVIDHHRHLK